MIYLSLVSQSEQENRVNIQVTDLKTMQPEKSLVISQEIYSLKKYLSIMKPPNFQLTRFIQVLLVTGAVFFAGGGPLTARQHPVAGSIHSAFNPKAFAWNITWPGRISQYDLVFRSPPVDPMQGIPLGNGDVAALAWCEDSRVILAVNKCDLWDDAISDKPETWYERYDQYTTQRHACRIIIDFNYPVFNTLYLSDFSARLKLADATLTLEGKSPFGEVGLRAFIDHRTGTLICNLESSFSEDVPVQVSLERYGSRTFSMWYTRMKRDATVGLAGTDAKADSQNMFLTQQLTSGTFATGGSVIQSNGLTAGYSREHSHCTSVQLSGNRSKKARLAFSVTSPGTGNPVAEAKSRLDEVREKGTEPFRKSHEEAWKAIWDRSFMDYGDDYLNNLWHLTIYYANASQGGKYPGRFNNGLWGWSRDIQQWNFYFHWNQQQLYWPLNAAGYHDLVAPYLGFRFNSLRHARKDAREFYQSEGAFISDVTNRNGYNRIDADVKDNHTPVAEIALEFWRQYQYTCDRKFLTEKALPFITEAARFLESRLEKRDDGWYHAKESTGYEGWIKLTDGLTELVAARTVFSTALQALKVAGTDSPDERRWKEILVNLAPVPVVKAGKDLIGRDGEKFTVNYGVHRGATVPADETVAAGWGIRENKWLTTYYYSGDPEYSFLLKNEPAQNPVHEMKLLDGIFPAVPWSPVFPSGMVGLAQKDSALYKVMTATTLLYGKESMGWDPVPVVMARLGLTAPLAANLEHFPERWQIYCNGWGHIAGAEEMKKDAEWFFRTNNVSIIGSPDGEKVPLPVWPFRHMSMESMSILATAMNESMLQSFDGTIRLFPAFPSGRTGRFTLHATGGFVVSAETDSGHIRWISVKSLYGNPLRMELPWKKTVIQSSLRKSSRLISGMKTELPTRAGEEILLVPDGVDTGSWSVVSEQPLPNEKVKYHSSGKTQLGIPRMF
jgi:hypothetical protein